MKIHELKIKEEYFNEVEKGNKTFEIRRDDRDYCVGDLIKFCVLSEEGVCFLSEREYEITYILRNCPQYGLMDGYCVLGIKEIK